MKKNKKIWLAIFGIIVILVTLLIKNKNKNNQISTQIQKGTVSEELILTGQIEAQKHVNLFFPTSGKLIWIGVNEGQVVKKGQALVSLDKTMLNSAYQQALNTLKTYQAAAENTLDLVKGHSDDETFAQKAQRTAAEAARDSAYDAVIAAEYNLNNSTLFAPFAGVIASLPFTSPGMNVSYVDKIVEIVDPTSLYFEVNADQSEVINIKEGVTVSINLDSFPKNPISGKVSFVGVTPKSAELGTVYKIKVLLENIPTDLLLKVGMTGDVKFILQEKNDVLFVPPRFINTDKDGKFVYLGNKNKKVRVIVGIEGEDRTEIQGDFKAGDLVID